MKLLATIRHPHPAETRSGSRDANTSADDSPRQAFDGVLAKVTRKPSQTAPNAQAPGSAALQQADPSRNAAAAPTGAPDALGSNSEQVASKSADESDEPLGKLLKRLKSDDGGDGSNPKSDASVLGANLSLVSGLAAGAAAALATGDCRDGMKKADGAQTSASQTADGPGAAERHQNGVAPQAESTLVLGVSVSTHMAPTKGDEGRRQPADDGAPQPDQHSDGPSTTSAVSDNAGSPGHDDRPPGDGKPDAAASQNKIEASSAAPVGVAAPQAPIQGIATAVAKLASEAASAAAAPDNPKAVSTAPAHTVTLQMSPGDLGTVEIRMHLSGQALDLQLTISEQRTLGLVARERDTLSKALEAHHYELNSLVIQDGSAAAPSGGPHVAQHESSGDAPAERQSGGSPGSGAQTGGGGRQGQDADRPARGSLGARPDASPRSRVVDGRSLFI